MKAFDTVVHGLLPEEEIQEAKLKLLHHLSLKVKYIEAGKLNDKHASGLVYLSSYYFN